MAKASSASPQLDAKIKLYQTDKSPSLLGFADLTIDGAFVIKGISIRTGKADPMTPFVSFPSRRGTGENGDKFFDIAHPITPEAHAQAKEMILRKYQEAVEGRA